MGCAGSSEGALVVIAKIRERGKCGMAAVPAFQWLRSWACLVPFRPAVTSNNKSRQSRELLASMFCLWYFTIKINMTSENYNDVLMLRSYIYDQVFTCVVFFLQVNTNFFLRCRCQLHQTIVCRHVFVWFLFYRIQEHRKLHWLISWVRLKV